MSRPRDGEGYLPDIYVRFGREHPKTAEAYGRLAETCRDAGPLTDREQRLVKLGVAVGLASEGAVRSHVRRGMAEGMTPDQLIHAIVLAIPTAGFPASMAAYQWAHQVLDNEAVADGSL
jgi:4-carboxymuconolactone decarboxylase